MFGLATTKSNIKQHVTNAYVGGTITNEAYERIKKANTDYCYLDNYYMSQYFVNLKHNFPLNSHGSCNYVAISMLLSYYDTYWSDDIIPESYECASEIESHGESNLPAYTTESPGVEQYNNGLADVSAEDYLSACLSNTENDFQSLLFSIADEICGGVPLDSSGTFGLDFKQTLTLMAAYLFEYRGFQKTDITAECERNENDVYRFTVDNILKGYPVLVRTSRFYGHTYIAYDYDADTDIIYGHAGINGLNHIPIGNSGDLDWYDAIVIKPNFEHQHAKNYIDVNSTFCPCAYGEVPISVTLSNDATRDTAPNIILNTKYRDTWCEISKRTYNVCIYPKSSKEKVVSRTFSGTRKITLTDNEWKKVIYECDGYRFKIEVNAISSINSKYQYSGFLEKPYGYDNADVIYAESLVDQLNTNSDEFEEYEAAGITFKLKYKNITNTNSTMLKYMPYAESYTIFNFYDALDSIDIDLSFAQTYVTNKTSDIAEITEMHGGEQTTLIDFITPDVILCGDTKEKTILHIDFTRPTYRFSIRSKSNRGLLMSQMALFFSNNSMPLSGGELEYEPEKWNGADIEKYNCYNYAVNTKEFTHLSHDFSKYFNGYTYTKEDIVLDFWQDTVDYGFGFKSISQNERCGARTYKVALYLDPDLCDFHWYRQNPDGTWSHKLGKKKVTNLDAKGNLIYNPEKSDRNFNSSTSYNTKGYSRFLGFFEVSPTSYI